MENRKIHKSSGFTLIEVIAVLVVVSVISAVVISRLMSSSPKLIAQADVIKSHLRYAQARAMSSNVIWGISCDGSSYWLFKDGNTATKVVLPGEEPDNTIVLSTQLDAEYKGTISMEAFTISFNDRGVPYTDAAASSGNELTAGDPEEAITLSSGGDSQTITITPNTGFIP